MLVRSCVIYLHTIGHMEDIQYIDVCCYIDPETGIGCSVTEGLWEITYGPEIGDYTQGCRTHLGALMPDDVVATVFSVKEMTPLGELRGLLYGP